MELKVFNICFDRKSTFSFPWRIGSNFFRDASHVFEEFETKNILKYFYSWSVWLYWNHNFYIIMFHYCYFPWLHFWEILTREYENWQFRLVNPMESLINDHGQPIYFLKSCPFYIMFSLYPSPRIPSRWGPPELQL